MFGSRLKMARERAGFNQTELGRLIGVEQQQINRWESGKNMPNIDAVSALARTLNVSTDFLLGLSETLTGHLEYDDELKPAERRALTYWRRGDIVGAIKAIVGE
jgi:transcriptional regulator with XRE-family HTH domain